MNFGDSIEEAEFRVDARRWLEQNKPHKWEELVQSNIDERVGEGRRWQKKKAAAGWACLQWPTEFGGRSATPIQQLIWQQEEGTLSEISSITTLGVALVGPTIIAHGSDEQRRVLLPRIASGDDIWCQLFSEPGAGSDLAGVKTTARKTNAGWSISGHKIWTSFAHVADRAILLARTDSSIPKHSGLTMFEIDMRAPGISIEPIRQITGDTEFNEVFLDKVTVPECAVIGGVDNGWNVALTTLASERSAIGDVFVSDFGTYVRKVSNCDFRGEPALSNSAVCCEIAEMYVANAGIKNLNLRLQSALSNGKVAGPAATIAKLTMGKQRQRENALLMDLNANSYCADTGWDQSPAKAYLRAAGNRIEGGSDEILRNIIAERVLQLPGDIRVDKDIPFCDVRSSLE